MMSSRDRISEEFSYVKSIGKQSKYQMTPEELPARTSNLGEWWYTAQADRDTYTTQIRVEKNILEETPPPDFQINEPIVGTPRTTIGLPFAAEDLQELANRRGFASIEEYIVSLVWQDDDAQWDEHFAETGDALDHIAQQAVDQYLAGEVEDFDPDNDIDMP